jgi:hypothetical protein
MGQDIISGDTGSVTVRRIGAGTAHGLPKVQPAIVIATSRRAANSDYVVLTLEEAGKVAKAILAHLAEE